MTVAKTALFFILLWMPLLAHEHDNKVRWNFVFTRLQIDSQQIHGLNACALQNFSNQQSKRKLQQQDDMSEDKNQEKKRVAVIGGGVTGMAAAWHLHANSPEHQVYLFEAEDRLGGHAHTVQVPVVEEDGSENLVNVDIAFLVFNDDNYPNMIEWFKALSSSPLAPHPVEVECPCP